MASKNIGLIDFVVTFVVSCDVNLLQLHRIWQQYRQKMKTNDKKNMFVFLNKRSLNFPNSLGMDNGADSGCLLHGYFIETPLPQDGDSSRRNLTFDRSYFPSYSDASNTPHTPV